MLAIEMVLTTLDRNWDMIDAALDGMASVKNVWECKFSHHKVENSKSTERKRTDGKANVQRIRGC